MNKYILGSILFVLACLTGCDDSNDPFEGTDNFITSFTLKQGDQSLRGMIMLLAFEAICYFVICFTLSCVVRGYQKTIVTA